MHGGIRVRGCVSERAFVIHFVHCAETYKRKPRAVEWILVKFGKILSPVLEMVL